MAFKGHLLQSDDNTVALPGTIKLNTAGTISGSDYGILQDGDGHLQINTPTGKKVLFSVNDVDELELTSTNLYPTTNNGLALGISGTGFADLFLASGGTVDFDGGDATVVHSSGKLAINAATVQQAKGIKCDGLVIQKATETQTTDATVTTIHTITLEDEHTYQVEADIIGVKSDGTDRASYKIACTVYRTGAGVATLQGATTSIHAQESNADWDAAFTVSGNDLRVSVTGVAVTTIDWGGIVKYVNMSN